MSLSRADDGAPLRKQALRVHLLEDLLTNPALLTPPESLIPRIAFRGRITLFAAPRKAGKSTIVGSAVSAATHARQVFGGPTIRSSTLWCNLDEPLADAVRRFRVEQGDPRRIHIVEPPVRVADVVATAVAISPDILVVDTVSDLAVNEIENENDSLAVKKLLSPLRELARDKDIATILLHHTNRRDGRSRGSGVFEDIADLILTLSIDPHDPTIRKVEAEGRVGVESYRMRWTPDGLELADGPLTTDQLILAVIRARPGCSTRDIRDEVRKRPADIQLALATLRASGQIEDMGTRGRAKWLLRSPRNRLGTTFENTSGTASEMGGTTTEPPTEPASGSFPLRGNRLQGDPSLTVTGQPHQ